MAHLHRAFRAGLYVCATAIAVLAFYPLETQPVTGNDKINHLIAFAVLAGLADGAYPGRANARVKWLLLIAYGLAIEIVQRYLPYRHFSWSDLGADALGVFLYAGIARLASAARAAAAQGGGGTR
jgi:VanZ family protein